MRPVDYLGFAWTAAQCLVLAGVFSAGCYEYADRDAWISIVGGVMMTVSLLPAILGFRDLGTNLSPWPQPHATNELITHGIYRRLRIRFTSVLSSLPPDGPSGGKAGHRSSPRPFCSSSCVARRPMRNGSSAGGIPVILPTLEPRDVFGLAGGPE